MRAAAVRGLFALAVVLLPVQVWVANNYSEPYPGLFQPGFGGVPPDPTVVVSNEPLVTVRYEDGTEQVVPFAEVLPPGGPTARLLPFRSAFGDRARAGAPETAALLASRLEPNDAGSPPARMRVEWEEAVYDVETGERSVREVRSTVDVDLVDQP